jgi:hypothetical protein
MIARISLFSVYAVPSIFLHENSYLFLAFTPLRFILPGSNLLSQYKTFGEPENFNASDIASLPEDKKGFGSDSDVTSGSEALQNRIV